MENLPGDEKTSLTHQNTDNNSRGTWLRPSPFSRHFGKVRPHHLGCLKEGAHLFTSQKNAPRGALPERRRGGKVASSLSSSSSSQGNSREGMPRHHHPKTMRAGAELLPMMAVLVLLLLSSMGLAHGLECQGCSDCRILTEEEGIIVLEPGGNVSNRSCEWFISPLRFRSGIAFTFTKFDVPSTIDYPQRPVSGPTIPTSPLRIHSCDAPTRCTPLYENLIVILSGALDNSSGRIIDDEAQSYGRLRDAPSSFTTTASTVKISIRQKHDLGSFTLKWNPACPLGSCFETREVACSMCKKTCPAGSYMIECEFGSTSDTRRCSPCPEGSFQPNDMSESLACTLCPAGTYADTAGSSSCKVCPEGFYCPGGARAAKMCPVRSQSTPGSGECACQGGWHRKMVPRKDAQVVTLVRTRSLPFYPEYPGDGYGTPGTEIRLYQPIAVAVTSDGASVLIADGRDDCIKMMSLTTNQTTTFPKPIHIHSSTRNREARYPHTVGSGPAFCPGGGTLDRFSQPLGIAVHGKAAFVSDTGNHLIRRIDLLTGLVTTISGRPEHDGHKDGPPGEALFNRPAGIAVTSDGKILVVADEENHVVRSVVIATGLTKTLAGCTSGTPVGCLGYADGPSSLARFRNPTGVAIFENAAFIVDQQNGALRKIMLGTGFTTTVAKLPNSERSYGVAMMDASSALVSFNSGLVLVDIETGSWKVMAGYARGIFMQDGVTGYSACRNCDVDGPLLDARFRSLRGGIAVSGRHVVIADTGNDAVKYIALEPVCSLCRAGTFCPEGSVQMNTCANQSWSDAESDTEGDCKCDPGLVPEPMITGGAVSPLSGGPCSDGDSISGFKDGDPHEAKFDTPSGIAASADASIAVVCDGGNHAIRVIDLVTGHTSTLAGSRNSPGYTNGLCGSGPGAVAKLNSPRAVAIRGTTVLVTDNLNYVVRSIDMSALHISTLAGHPTDVIKGYQDGVGADARFSFLMDIAISDDGEIAVVAEHETHSIRTIVIATGATRTLAGPREPFHPGYVDGGAKEARFDDPRGITIHGATVFVADHGNSAVRKVHIQTGLTSTVADMASFSPYGISMHSGGAVAIVSSYNSLLRVDVESGAYAVIAGSDVAGTCGYANGQAQKIARFCYIISIAGTEHAVYLVDQESHGIRMVQLKQDLRCRPCDEVCSSSAGSPPIECLTSCQMTTMLFFVEWYIPRNGSVVEHFDILRDVFADVTHTRPELVDTILVSNESQSDERRQHLAAARHPRRASELTRLEAQVQVLAATSMVEQILLWATAELMSQALVSRGLYALTGFRHGCSPGSHVASGIIDSRIKTCSSCPSGFYCEGGILEPRRCFPNSSSEKGSDGLDDCDCGVGEYRGYKKNGSTVTTLVSSNFSSSEAAAAGQTVLGSTSSVSLPTTLMDGDNATARFFGPAGVGVTSDESTVVVADHGNNAIRVVNVANGYTFTVGGGSNGSGYLDGVLSMSRFSGPQGVALVNSSKCLVADTGNHAIRVVDIVSGLTSTLAGLGGFSGLVSGYGSDARFSSPFGMAVSSDGLWAIICDSGSHTIRKVLISTGEVSTIAGPPALSLQGLVDGDFQMARFNNPRGVAVYRNDAFIVDAGNYLLRKVNVQTGRTETVVSLLTTESDGGRVSSRNYLFGIAVMKEGSVVLASPSGQCLLLVDVQTKTLGRLAGSCEENGNINGASDDARFGIVAGLAVTREAIVIVDHQYNALRMLLPNISCIPCASSCGTWEHLEGTCPAGSTADVAFCSFGNYTLGLVIGLTVGLGVPCIVLLIYALCWYYCPDCFRETVKSIFPTSTAGEEGGSSAAAAERGIVNTRKGRVCQSPDAMEHGQAGSGPGKLNLNGTGIGGDDGADLLPPERNINPAPSSTLSSPWVSGVFIGNAKDSSPVARATAESKANPPLTPSSSAESFEILERGGQAGSLGPIFPRLNSTSGPGTPMTPQSSLSLGREEDMLCNRASPRDVIVQWDPASCPRPRTAGECASCPTSPRLEAGAVDSSQRPDSCPPQV